MNKQSMHKLFKIARAMLFFVILQLSLGSLNVKADAASSYKIHHEILDENDYYYVYKNKAELEETPTFIATPNDVYYSENKENCVKISFFRSYNIHSSSQADEFYKYLLDQSSARQCCAGWYRATSSQYGYEEAVTIVYLIEGLNPRWDYYLECLWDWNPFLNARGTRLNLELLEENYKTDRMPELWSRGYSAVISVKGDHGHVSPYAMMFTEGFDRHIVRRYCVYETWD